jgi:hypothetical protein
LVLVEAEVIIQVQHQETLAAFLQLPLRLVVAVVAVLHIHHCQAALAAVGGEMDRLVEHLEQLGKAVLAGMASKALV